MRSVGLADDLELVDRVGGGGSVELHGSAPRLGQHRGERALGQRQLERVVVGRLARRRAAAPSTALAPRGSSASAASTRHGLCATPPSATRPAAVALHDGRHRDQRERVGRAVAHLAVDLRAADRLRQRHRGDQLAGLAASSRCAACRRAGGGTRRSGCVRAAPSGRTVSTVASSARIATAMSLGCVAMQASLAPIDGELAADAADAPSSRCRAGACCRAGWCRRSTGSACAAAGCRRSSPCCAAGPRRRPAARATSTP